ncbi:MAG: CDP-alcohol phosphatidyltransferase family protein [Tannerella sp.]|jgi:CDP-diacylglycerol--serine O-phosphatidyltransferase|nr:CDP-alcohol phosphatidyltransferase family protein [Tannerella sp.]
MKRLVRHIPNTLTCANLSFGFYASALGYSGEYYAAMIAILIAAVFDFADGFAARLLKAYSPIGKELDSLADVVSFGVAPGMMLFGFLDELLHTLQWDSFPAKLLLLAAFAPPVFSALRLAKFNIDDRQKTFFIGLPVPAHAILWASLVAALSPTTVAYETYPVGITFAATFSTLPHVGLLFTLSALAIATSLLLVSTIPMFSLKMTSPSFASNKLAYIQLFLSVILILSLGLIGLTASIVIYIALSVLIYRKSVDVRL